MPQFSAKCVDKEKFFTDMGGLMSVNYASNSQDFSNVLNLLAIFFSI
jgi:hypothetical protein